jgi:hypothetical protein
LYSIAHRCQHSLPYHYSRTTYFDGIQTITKTKQQTQHKTNMSKIQQILSSDESNIDQSRSLGEDHASPALYAFVAQATYTSQQASIRSMHTTYHSLFHPTQNIAERLKLDTSIEKVRLRLCRVECLHAAA